MKPINFKHSMLTVGVVAALGMTGTSFAAPSGGGASGVVETPENNSTFQITNQATANYNVGSVAQPEVTSNIVTVTVSKKIRFSLAKNRTGTVTPKGKVVFNHTLVNDGNIEDTYKIDVANVDSGDNFDFSDFKIEVTKTGGAKTVVTNGDKISLTPGQQATITVTATADGNNTLNQSGKLTVSATSDLYPAGGSNDNKLTNTDTATTTTPVFAIAKSVSTLTVQKGGEFTYTIKVKNTGNMDATATTITDALPEGLEFADSPSVVVKRGTTDINDSVNVDTSSNTLTITNVNIKQAVNDDEDITVTFKVKVPASTAVGKTFDNVATVIDDPDDDSSTDNNITDSSTKSEKKIPGGDENDTNPDTVTVVPVSTYSATISTNEEVTLPRNGSNIFTHIITNTGSTTLPANDLTLVQNVTTEDENIKQTFYIDTNKSGTFEAGEDTEYTPGNPLPVALAPQDTIKIFVKNTAKNAATNNHGRSKESEKYNLSLTSTTIQRETGDQPNSNITDTISVAGLELKKEHTVNRCTSPTALSYQTTAITEAEPGQCIYYKITAINHLPTTNPSNLQNFTNVAVSDNIKNLGTGVGKVTYNGDLAGTSGMTVNYNAPNVTGNVATLAAGGEESLTFSVKINAE